jgi:hypothetical protein
MNTRVSLTGRALLALALMAGFYLLALLVVAGLAAILYEEIHTKTFSYGATIVAVLGIYAILVGITPRREHFEPPGPLLTKEEQPRINDEIRTIAEATHSEMPREIYLVPDVNAAVAHVGGFAGIGSRPIMLVGLPLMAVLTTPELRGVLAHEFGHYSGGDTRLGPLTYRTRSAMFRTIIELLKRRRKWLHRPFIGTHACTCGPRCRSRAARSSMRMRSARAWPAAIRWNRRCGRATAQAWRMAHMSDRSSRPSFRRTTVHRWPKGSFDSSDRRAPRNGSMNSCTRN